MGREHRISNQWFYRQYGIFGGAFILLCAGASAACFMDFHSKLLVPAALAAIALLLIFFVKTIKKGRWKPCWQIFLIKQKRRLPIYCCTASQGMGISEEEVPKIFQRFYRGRDAAASGVDGLGIGLYLAREMITAQKGYVKVSSAKGQGSRFSVFLPAE